MDIPSCIDLNKIGADIAHCIKGFIGRRLSLYSILCTRIYKDKRQSPLVDGLTVIFDQRDSEQKRVRFVLLRNSYQGFTANLDF